VRQWIEDFHVDGLRLDAVDAIVDQTARTFVEELTAEAHAAAAGVGRRVLVTAESAANDPRLVTPVERGGLGVDAMWNDDVHHSLRVALLEDRHGYYLDYRGADDLAAALAHRWVFRGRYSVYRRRRHGRSADHVEHRRLIVFSANHDHVGNTPDGRRPPFDRDQRLTAAATVVLSPFTPLLFMGEEYAETAPFPFFVDHGDPHLLEATRHGRAEEFAGAGWDRPVADPAAASTFAAAVLDPGLAERSPHREVLAAYRELLRLRRELPVLSDPVAGHEVMHERSRITVRRQLGVTISRLILVVGADADGDLDLDVDIGPGDARTRVAFDSGDPRWGGPGPTFDASGRPRRAGPAAVLLITE
jgi:maltooligosyltrehalose trehalohydrolase